MKNKLRFLMKNKQSFIAFFILLAMVFNAYENPSTGKPEGSNAGDFTLIGFYVDSDGNLTEMDSGRTRTNRTVPSSFGGGYIWEEQ